MKLDRTQKAAVVAGVICRRWYGVPLINSGHKLLELTRIGFQVVNALEKAEAQPSALPQRRRALRAP